MKNWSAGEWILFVLTLAIAGAILLSVGGVVFRGSSVPNEGATQTRVAITELLKYLSGAVVGCVATLLSNKTK